MRRLARLKLLKDKLERAFVEGDPEALKFDQEVNNLIVPGQRAILRQDGKVRILNQTE